MAERESWGNHCEFFLTSLGLAVGLGNVWRFPYIAFQNGGGSFLIPYCCALFFVGLPAFFLELSAGQYGRVGANKVWGRMVPALKGLGYGMLLVRFLVNIYYVVICAWCMVYLVVGFQNPLPWADCGNYETNTRGCYSNELAATCKELYNNTQMTYYNSSEATGHSILNSSLPCISYQEFCASFNLQTPELPTDAEICVNTTANLTYKFSQLYKRMSPAEDYYNRVVLGLIKDYEGNIHTFQDYGSLKWDVVLGLLVSWLLICLILIKGLKSLGKASYVITMAPYFVLTALLAYGLQLKGSGEGIRQLFQPDWSVYTSSNSYDIWSLATSQILFSLSLGFGSQLVLSSYNNVNNNCHRDALLIGIFNSLTSIFAGIVVFAILGNLADGGDIKGVVKGGPSLAFVAYPEAVLRMDFPPIWSFLFFFMLINLALSSICGGVQTFLAFILDEWPSLSPHRIKIVIGTCVVFCLLGLPMCTTGGLHLFNIFDQRCTSSLLLLCFIEIVLVAWVYGSRKFFSNIEEMIRLPSWIRAYWLGMWTVIVPCVVAAVVILKWYTYVPMSYDNEEYPAGVQVVGWIFELLPTCIVLIYPLWSYRKLGFPAMFQPSEKWETTSARAILQAAKVNDAYFDDTIYKVSPANTLEKTTETQQEKLTEL